MNQLVPIAALMPPRSSPRLAPFEGEGFALIWSRSRKANAD
jgi:hypothetical protein